MKRRRYPGSKPFVTAQQDIFFGRNRDIADLTKLIELEQSVVLYGKSGLGKSSLIEAGIIPKIAEKKKYEIIKIRFGAYVEGQHEVAPLVQALEYLESEPNWLDDQFNFNRKGNPNRKSNFNFNFANLWHVLKRRQIEDERDGYLLIFDQFEELFTYPEAQVADFARQLAEVQYTNIPQHYHDFIDEGFDADDSFLTDDQMRQLHRQLQVKTLMGIRSDRMSYMNQLKPYLPEILVHTYELKALDTTAASHAIRKPALPEGDFLAAPFDYDDTALRNILRYLTKDNTQGIESFQLQIFCEHIEDLVIQHKHPIISLAQIGTQEDVEQIFEHYYRDKIADFGSPDQQLAVRRLIEEGLIFEAEERRLNLYEGQITQAYNVTKALLDQLVDSRLLRAEPSMRGGYTYELSHDTLVAPVLKAKVERVAEEARQKAARIETQRQQELAEAQAKAEAEKQRADKEKRLRIRASAISAIAGCLLLMALAAGGFAISKAKEADEAKIEAESERDKAVKAEEQTKQSLIAEKQAKDETKLALKQAQMSEQEAIEEKNRAKIAEEKAKQSLIAEEKALKQTKISEQKAIQQKKIAEEQTQIAEEKTENLQAVLDKLYFYGDSLALAYNGRKFGFINKKGKVLIDYRYKEAVSFDYRGYAKVKIDEIDYLINTEGIEYRWTDNINILDENIEAFDFSEQLEFEIDNVQEKVLRNTQLKTLVVRGSKIQQLSSAIGNLDSLEYLNLSGTELSALPPEIGQLKLLRVFDLGSATIKIKTNSYQLVDNNLSSLPVEIGQLENLQSLELSDNQLTILPPEIGQLTKLQNLNLRQNRLTILPSEIGQLKKLQNLNLSLNRKLSSLPKEIGRLTNLQDLDLSHTNLSTLPSEIGKLANLQILNLGFNPSLTSLPSEIGQLSKLRTLNLWKNNLSFLPSEIGQLTNLQTLDLRKNNLTSLPPEIGQLTNLQSLRLYKNKLKSLPPEIGQLKNLQKLELSSSELQSLPSEIGQLINLQDLDLNGNNNLYYLPAEIGQLTNLQILNLGGSSLTSLPIEIIKLKSLKKLHLWRSKLKFFPTEVTQLKSLEYLNIGDNDFTQLPMEIGRLTNLQELDLSGTTNLSSIPVEIGQLTNLQSLNVIGTNLSEEEVQKIKKLLPNCDIYF